MKIPARLRRPAGRRWSAGCERRRRGCKNELQKPGEGATCELVVLLGVVDMNDDDASCRRDDDVLAAVPTGGKAAQTRVGPELHAFQRDPPEIAVADPRPCIGVGSGALGHPG